MPAQFGDCREFAAFVMGMTDGICSGLVDNEHGLIMGRLSLSRQAKNRRREVAREMISPLRIRPYLATFAGGRHRFRVHAGPASAMWRN
jgi:hypothetical protein